MAVTGYFVNDTASTIGLTDVKATLDTDSSQGANAALIFTAVEPGVRGNSVKVEQVLPADNNVAVAESVSVRLDGAFKIVSISLAVDTDGSTITSTGDTIKASCAASPEVSALVTVADKAANDGSGLASAFAAAALTGGTKDDILKGEIRKVTAMADADAVSLINGGATFIPAASYARRRAIARLIKYGKVDETRQS